MCKISVIVPVYKVERYLRTCLDSLVNQTLEDIEIIAVNDGSPDNSPAILEEYEKKYSPKVRVYSIENHGVSYARNYGADRANGEYLLFVDSDDFVEPQMCEVLYEKASGDGNDIVLCNRNNIYETPGGKDTVNKNFMMTASQNFTISQYPFELCWISPFPWDKLVKRELFLSIKFPENIRFEDLAYVLKLACVAESIGVVKDHLYNYRRTTTGGFLNSFSEDTLDIVKAFDNVMSFMKEHKFDGCYREELAYICTRHFFYRYPALFYNKEASLKLKKCLLNETHDFLDLNFPDWRENHYLKYSSSPAVKKRLNLYCSRKKLLLSVTLNRIVPQGIQQRARSFGKKISGFLRELKHSRSRKKVIVQKLKFLRVFRRTAGYEYTKACLKTGVNKRQIFMESGHGEDIGGDIFHMIRIFQRPEFEEYQVLLAVNEKSRQKWKKLSEVYQLDRVQTLEVNSQAYSEALAVSGYLVTDASLPSYFVKRDEQVYFSIPGETPLKMLGRQVQGREFGLGDEQRNFLISDLMLFQNEYSRDIFLDDYMLRNVYPGRVMLAGHPRSSALLQGDMSERIRRGCGLGEKQVIAYMPVWRGALSKKNFEIQVKIIYQYLSQIDRLLTDNQLFFVKLHPYVEDSVDYSVYRHIRSFPEEYETYDFLSAADILVTDYSGVMFDFGATGKKMILFTYDRDAYLGENRMYIDLNEMGLPTADTAEELITEIEKPNNGYADFQEKFCHYDAPDAAEKVCHSLVFGEDGVKTEYPETAAKRKKVLLYLDNISDKINFSKLIQEINQVDADECDYYICFKESAAQKNTLVLRELKKEIGYLPLAGGLDATNGELAARWVYLRLGMKNGIINRKMKDLCERELKKYFGNIQFDYVMYFNGMSLMNLKMLSYMQGKKICNLTKFSLNSYQNKKAYRSKADLMLKGKAEFDVYCINQEFTKTGIYNKTKNKANYRVMDLDHSSIRKMMEV
ncbi:CDP-glycerol glycerophosphotransferase family protein [Ruminococcus sp. OA3]|uniref:bifunctional glycosyltransferase/CDP-glycerol:glycerophosphate glycerophosphotransferase n=1 Tax=Ruminococcus sp. OA3 TaxID=2914164 RepID=UPI001F06B8F7|nr:CDP-glycerol glycerophosphotransferase family protein [Ruminococcus sp. OA3]MCH1982156.1 CDP-glycerol glycerophosphotransferase family protein [Ruminococcus sp. OA3]